MMKPRMSKKEQERIVKEDENAKKANLWIETGPTILTEQIMKDYTELKRLLENSKSTERISGVAVGVNAQPKSKVPTVCAGATAALQNARNDQLNAASERNVVSNGKNAPHHGWVPTRKKLQSQLNEESCAIYTKTKCSACATAKSVLFGMGAAFTVVELDKVNGAIKTELVAITGVMTVPQVFVGGKFIGGCNDGGLGGVVPLSKSGELITLFIEVVLSRINESSLDC